MVEASRANIFCVKDGIFYTPFLESGCLEGITRGIMLKVIKAHRKKCVEAALTPGELLRADEIFLTNSIGGVMPVV